MAIYFMPCGIVDGHANTRETDMRTYIFRLIGLTLLVSSFVLSLGEPARSQTPSKAVNHIVIIVLENQDVADVMKDPYFTALTTQGAWLANSRAVTHPSYPNYLALVGGDTFNRDHSNKQTTLTERFIVDQIEDYRKTWRAYSEGYPGGCFLDDDNVATFWVRKHVPFLSFASVQTDKARCQNVVDAMQFKNDLDTGRLPNYAFYTPNMRNSGHNTNLRFASAWLRNFLGSFQSRLVTDLADTLVIITFDESENPEFGKNDVFTVLLGSMVTPGRYKIAVTHYTLLRTIEHLLGLPTLGRHDDNEAPISGIWAVNPIGAAFVPVASIVQGMRDPGCQRVSTPVCFLCVAASRASRLVCGEDQPPA